MVERAGGARVILSELPLVLTDAKARLARRLRLADDLVLIAETNGRHLHSADRDGAETINVASDEPLIRSLDLLGFVSLAPAIRKAQQ